MYGHDDNHKILSIIGRRILRTIDIQEYGDCLFSFIHVGNSNVQCSGNICPASELTSHNVACTACKVIVKLR
jgi:hypothetical protein